MTELHLTGSVQRPLTHMALFGLATILDEAGLPDVRIAFTDESTPRACATVTVEDPTDIGTAVLAHARQRAQNSWVTATMTHEDLPGKGVMSPRLKTPASREAWVKLQCRRRATLDGVTDRRLTLDLRMLAGLGEPAYWRYVRDVNQPDLGASRWEMITRTKGKDFVSDRLSPLAQAVAGRTPQQIIDGLTGACLEDVTTRNASDSRTATGFAPAGPVDSTVAWCALWGLANFPVVHNGTLNSRTPGAHRWNRVHPDVMVLPVCTVPISVPRLRVLLRSAELDALAAALVGHRPTEITNRWLSEHGMRALMRFDVEVSETAGSPERRILDGDVIPLV